MDPKVEFNKVWKDLQDSAREVASFGLAWSSKALDFTASTLKSVEDTLKKQAERLAPKGEEKGDGEKAEEPKA